MYNSKEININSTFIEYRTKEDEKTKIMKIEVLENNEEYLTKINYKFSKNPNIKFVADIINNKNGSNIFDVFISFKDSKEYIVTINTNYINIFSLLDYKKIVTLKGHNARISKVKYFINNNNYNEYLVSTDYKFRILVWDITNNFNIIQQIQTSYKYLLNNILLVFPHNQENNYIVVYGNKVLLDSYEQKIYSLNNGNPVKENDIGGFSIIFYILL